MSEEIIYASLVAFNQERIRPPKPDADLRRISKSIARYQPDVLDDWSQRVAARHTSGTVSRPEKKAEAVKPASIKPVESYDSWPIYDANELIHMALPDVEFLPLFGAPGWIVRGWSHLIAASPFSGKTEMLAAAVMEWIDMGLRVFWQSEESADMWVKRLRLIHRHSNRGADVWERLRIRLAMGMPVDQMLKDAYEHKPDVVIVDTMRNLLGVENENDSAQMAAAVRPWCVRAQQDGSTLLVLHHTRKAGGDNGDAVSGGLGLISVVDVVLEVRRVANQDQQRELHQLARLIPRQEPSIYEMDPDSHACQMLGSKTQVSSGDIQDRIVVVLRSQDAGMLTREIRENIGDPCPSIDTVERQLKKMAEAGAIQANPPVGSESAGKKRLWSLAKPPQAVSDLSSKTSAPH